MLKKINRLSKVRNFKTAKTIRSEAVDLKISQERQGQPRFAFIVSKRLDKRAVKRNKIKRMLSKSVELEIGKAKNSDYLIIAKNGILGKEGEDIRKQISLLLNN